MQKIIQDRNKKLLVDMSTNRITLLDSRFYYTDEKDPVPIPSVTTILDCYPKGYAFYQWLKDQGNNADDVLAEAGRRGSTVHDLTERYDRGEKISLLDENNNLGVYMIEWAMFERYVDFTTRFKPEHKIIEANIVSKKINAAGTLDRVTVINGVKWLIDIKTSPTIYDHFWVQLGAYEEMLKTETGEKVDKVGVLHLNAKIRTENPKEIQGIGWKLYEMPNKPSFYYDLFKATQKLWYIQNGQDIPKNTIYQLAHQLPKPAAASKSKKK